MDDDREFLRKMEERNVGATRIFDRHEISRLIALALLAVSRHEYARETCKHVNRHGIGNTGGVMWYCRDCGKNWLEEPFAGLPYEMQAR